MSYITHLNYYTMAKATPSEIKTRSGNRKAVYVATDTWAVIHARIETAPLGKIKVDPKMGDAWFYPESSLYHPDQLRDIVYLMERVGRKKK